MVMKVRTVKDLTTLDMFLDPELFPEEYSDPTEVVIPVGEYEMDFAGSVHYDGNSWLLNEDEYVEVYEPEADNENQAELDTWWDAVLDEEIDDEG
jgi:hypothetical protein